MFDKDVFGKNRSAGNGRNVGSTPVGRPITPDTPAETAAQPKQAESVATQEGGSKLIVGPNIKLKGAEITDCDTLVVEGRVEASMNSRVIQILEGGTFTGKVEIDVAEIRGKFEGELTVRKRLIVFSSGRVSGKIRYGKMSIEDGGEIAGDIASLNTRSDAGRAPVLTEANRQTAQVS
ncbi:MAG TPA: polymer-forming cytoskeletal protein [Burkholderiales bacterium]|nr:polymer-forming cytoskeletal protein [Burkholderiales bacterium]